MIQMNRLRERSTEGMSIYRQSQGQTMPRVNVLETKHVASCLHVLVKITTIDFKVSKPMPWKIYEKHNNPTAQANEGPLSHTRMKNGSS